MAVVTPHVHRLNKPTNQHGVSELAQLLGPFTGRRVPRGILSLFCHEVFQPRGVERVSLRVNTADKAVLNFVQDGLGV